MTVNENGAVSLGSDSWNGAANYETGGIFHERATKFFASVKWNVLTSLCSSLRNGIPCKIGEKFSIGHFNMVRRIAFEDGISWVARLRLPLLEEDSRDIDALDRSFRVEIASMKFLRAKTSIPVPNVYRYNADPANDVGAPYILMDYIDGTVATELRAAQKCDIGSYGTPDQDRKFKEQMARIQVELSSFTFDQIGSLYLDEKTSDFFVGPETDSGKGPWAASTDYYIDIANHALRVCVAEAAPDVQASCSFALPILFQHLISVHDQKSSRKGPFRLTNRDFGAHNLLVNNDFEIICVIDLDGVMAAPIEVVAQFPTLSGLEREPPGHVETKPAAIERIKRTAPKLKEYQNLVEAAEAREGGRGNEASIANVMFSDAASLYQGLLDFSGQQKFVNDRWMEVYLRLLREHIRSGESLSF